MKLIRNKSGDKVHGMAGGNDYRFGPREIQAVPDADGTHLLETRGQVLEELDPSLVEFREKDAKDTVPELQPVQPGILCPFCRQDFSDKKDPAYSMAQHIFKVHKVLYKLNEVRPLEAEDGAGEDHQAPVPEVQE